MVDASSFNTEQVSGVHDGKNVLCFTVLKTNSANKLQIWNEFCVTSSEIRHDLIGCHR
jgi:hypothetical protein